MAEDAKRLPRNASGDQYDPGTCDETHQTTGGGETLLQNCKHRTKRDQLDNTFRRRKHLIERTNSEVDRTSSVVDGVSAGAWSGELDRELCGLAEAHGKNTVMSTLSSAEMSSTWTGAHRNRSTLRSKSVQHAGKGTATQLGGTGSHLIDPPRRRLEVKSLKQARQQHLWFRLRWGSYCTTSQTGDNRRTEAQNQSEREKKRRPQHEYKGALELARVHTGPGGDGYWEWPGRCSAWNFDLIQEGLR